MTYVSAGFPVSNTRTKLGPSGGSNSWSILFYGRKPQGSTTSNIVTQDNGEREEVLLLATQASQFIDLTREFELENVSLEILKGLF